MDLKESPWCRAVIGLGNPGPDYERSRHNLGFMAAHAIIAHGRKMGTRSAAGLYRLDIITFAHRRLLVVRPRTFMNRSGFAVAELIMRFHLDPKEILIVYDDIALPLGTLRLRKHGSGGGHRGLTHILQVIGTQDLPRLRLGILPPDERPDDLATFVLAPFQNQEWPIVQAMLNNTVRLVAELLDAGYDKTMSRWNYHPAPGAPP